MGVLGGQLWHKDNAQGPINDRSYCTKPKMSRILTGVNRLSLLTGAFCILEDDRTTPSSTGNEAQEMSYGQQQMQKGVRTSWHRILNNRSRGSGVRE